MMGIHDPGQSLCCCALNRILKMKGIPGRSPCCFASNRIVTTKGIPGRSPYCYALNRNASVTRVRSGQSLYCCALYQIDQMMRIQNPGRNLYCSALNRSVKMFHVVEKNHYRAHWKYQTSRNCQSLLLIPRGNYAANCPS